MINKIPYKDHEEWLKLRQGYVGGSDAAAVIGMNAYASPYSVWADKLGKVPPKEDNEAMRIGRDLEEYVAERFTEKSGKKVRRCNFILVNDKYPFAHANVDRLIVGEDAGLECKTTSVLNLKNFKNGDFPENYYAQSVHYMAVTEYKRWYVGVLVLGKGFYIYQLTRIPGDTCPEWCESSLYVDDNEIAALMGAEREFWHYVETKTPPPIDGLKSSTEALSVMYPESSDAIVDLYPYNNTLMAYTAVCAQIKTLEKEKDELANQVKLYLKDAQGGENDKFKVSYKSSVRQTFDHKAFAKDHPNLNLANYYKTSQTRIFKVTQK